MAYEDVDWCLRAWQAGFGVLYFPAAQLVHHESVTRGTEVGERERASQRLFWERWGDFFDARAVTAGPTRSSGGRLRIVYVTEDTGVGGGHRDIFEHLNRLADARPRGGAVHARRAARLVRAARAGAQLRRLRRARRARSPTLDAIKVATWWMTAAPVWRASVAARHPRLLRAGHRDLLLPRRRARPPRRARLLPAGVPLHDDLLVEPRAPARARPRRRADPAGDRPRDLPPARGRARAARTWCSRSGAPTR